VEIPLLLAREYLLKLIWLTNIVPILPFIHACAIY
jgi:hypothetical protein